MNKRARELAAAGRRTEREARVAALRLGVRQRAVTVPDKKKKASREACRRYRGD